MGSVSQFEGFSGEVHHTLMIRDATFCLFFEQSNLVCEWHIQFVYLHSAYIHALNLKKEGIFCFSNYKRYGTCGVEYYQEG